MAPPHFHRSKRAADSAADTPDVPHQPLIDDADGLAQVMQDLRDADRLAIDTEFHSERTYTPRLMLLQVATPKNIWLIDPLALDLRPVVEELARPERLVVGHALRNDLRILWQVYGIALSEVFDTQVAAAFLGHGLQVGLGHLIQRALRITLPKGEQMADWGQRPLPDKLKAYAMGDVAHMFELHRILSQELASLGRLEWLLQECRSLCAPGQYDRDPTTAGDRIAGARRLEAAEMGAVYALAELRERLASQEDVVPHFLVPDEALLTLAKLKPKQARDIQGDRRLQQRAVQRNAQQWVDAVAAGLANPIRRAPGRAPPLPELEAVATLAMLLVGEIAGRERIAAPLLARRDAVTEALREIPTSQAQFCELAGLSGWRETLVGVPLWQFLMGQHRVRCRPGGEAGFALHFEPDAG